MSLPIKNYLTKDLRFKDHELEKQYLQSKIKYQRNFLCIVLLFGFLIGIVGWAINPMKQTNYEGVPLGYRLSLLGLLLICSVCAWKKPNLSEKQIIILILFYFIGLMETSSKNRPFWNNVMFFLTGMNIQFILIPSILAKICWKATCLLSVIINTLNCLRYTDFEENYRMNFYPLIQFIQNAVLISASAYLVEKFNRESFYKMRSYEISLFQFKDLLKNLFPCSVIIASDRKILFNNKESFKLFGCQNADELWENIGNVKLEPASPVDQLENTENEKILITNEQQEDFSLFEKQNITLQDAAFIHSKIPRLTQENFHGEYEKAGKRKTLDIKITEIDWENKKALLIIISENFVLQKMNLMREQAIHKNRMLATVSHDLKTPLSGIIGMITMTLEGLMDLAIRKYLKIVLRSSRLLYFMVNDMMDYSRLSSGGIFLNKECFSLWNSILEVSKLFKFQAKMKNICFEKRNMITTNNKKAFIINDKGRFKQVLFNLLGNALKFTVFGFIRITLKEHAPQAYEISVEDSGIGIKKEDQHKIFKMFGKFKDEENEYFDHTGIGLGLPLSQSLVKILNNYREDGVIKLKSECNKGSLFSFVIHSDGEIYDQHENLSEGLIIDDQNKIYKSPTMEKLNLILVVDSNRRNIEMVTNSLKSYECIFDVASSGEEALKLIKKRASSNFYYNLILVDYDLNKLIGIKVITVTKSMALKEEIPFVPVIGLTSDSTPECLKGCLELGMADNIVRPISKEVLKEKLDKYCT